MSHFDPTKFKAFMIENDVVGFFESPVTLKSGRVSPFYINWRTVAEDVFAMDALTDFVLAFVSDLGLTPDTFYGVPEGATKLGVLLQYKWARSRPEFSAGSHRLAMGRGKAKTHGDVKDQFFLGVPTGKTVVIEDVTTTGGSLIETVDRLQAAHVTVALALGLCHRDEKRDDGGSVESELQKRNVRYVAMSHARDILPAVVKERFPANKKQLFEQLVNYYDQYGIQKLRI